MMRVVRSSDGPQPLRPPAHRSRTQPQALNKTGTASRTPGRDNLPLDSRSLSEGRVDHTDIARIEWLPRALADSSDRLLLERPTYGVGFFCLFRLLSQDLRLVDATLM